MWRREGEKIMMGERERRKRGEKRRRGGRKEGREKKEEGGRKDGGEGEKKGGRKKKKGEKEGGEGEKKKEGKGVGGRSEIAFGTVTWYRYPKAFTHQRFWRSFEERKSIGLGQPRVTGGLADHLQLPEPLWVGGAKCRKTIKRTQNAKKWRFVVCQPAAGAKIFAFFGFWAPMRLALDPPGGWGVSRKPIIMDG